MASTREEERWQTEERTFIERNEYMWNKSLMTDVKFAFPNTRDASAYPEIIPAHKYVLAVGSPVFYRMFYGSKAEVRDILEITDSDPVSFRHFLRFLYCGETNFGELKSPINQAIDIMYLAEKYDVPLLSRECVKFLDGNMDPLKAFDIIPAARLLGDGGLEKACWEVIEYNAEVIAADKTFLDMEHELVLSFLERSHLHITEVNLFNAVDRWAAKQCEDEGMKVDGPSKRSVLGDSLLQKIRFSLMSPKEFSDVVLTKNILTQEEIIDVFTSLYSDYTRSSDVMFEFRPRAISAPSPLMRSFTSSSIQEEERWKTKRRTFMKRNEYMWKNSLMSDVKFAFPNTRDASAYPEIIPAHKYVLAVGSPVFYRMFYGSKAEVRDILEITDSDPVSFRHFLRFLYCGETNFGELKSPINQAIDIMYLAEKYDVPLLSRECVKFLDGNMDPLKAFDIIPAARLLGDGGLEKACWEVIEYNAEVIAADKTFLDMEHELVLSFLERSHLHITEVNLFNAVDRWAAKQCEDEGMKVDGPSKRSVLGDSLLQKIRFSLMSPKEFSDVVLTKNILTQEEIIDVFTSLYSDYTRSSDVMFEFRPRAISAPSPLMRSFTFSLKPLLRTSWQNICKSVMLSIKVSKAILLCGFQFLFNPTAESGCVSVTMWQRGVKMKQLIAKSRPNEWDTDSVLGQKKVFFNKPFTVDAGTCYTIELLGASSHSPSYYVTNDSSGFDTYPDQEDITTDENYDVTLKFCAGLHADDISLNRPYFGHIEKVLFTEEDCSLE